MVTFHYLETDHENIVRKDTEVFKEEILANFTCLPEESLESLVRMIAYAIDNGIDPSNTTKPSNWNWEQSSFYSGTIITTIGILFACLLLEHRACVRCERKLFCCENTQSGPKVFAHCMADFLKTSSALLNPRLAGSCWHELHHSTHLDWIREISFLKKGVGDQLYYYHRTKNAKDIKQ